MAKIWMHRNVEVCMIGDYIRAAMHHATYELLADGSFNGTIPDFAGVWADAATLEACCDELQDVLEGWILLRIADHLPLPVVDGHKLIAGKSA